MTYEKQCPKYGEYTEYFRKVEDAWGLWLMCFDCAGETDRDGDE